MKKALLLIVFIVITSPTTTRIRPDTDKAAEAIQVTPGSWRLPELLGATGMEGHAKATEPREFSFPADHGPHPEYRNEWWYLTGNLDAESGERFGFELTIFRFSLATGDENQEGRLSEWDSSQVYMGHFAITDVENAQFHVAQRFVRGSLGLAGAQARPFRVWLEDWAIEEVTLESDPDGRSYDGRAPSWRLRAAADDIAIDLAVVPMKRPVLHGDAGLSRKSSEPGNASYYYSISRLQTAGTLRVNDDDYGVTGLSWLDREWGSSALSSEQQGWDWFALQLSDGSELMLYNLRRNDGSQDPHSAGTWIAANGETTALSNDDFDILVRDYWDSPHGGRYPMGWQMRVEPLALTLHLDPVLKTQELNTTVRYWEGAVDASGRRNGHAISGRGYVELTGYAAEDARVHDRDRSR